MLRKDVEAFVGKRVSVWTGMNGSYEGVLLEVTEAKPFRARVPVLGAAAAVQESVQGGVSS